MLGNETRTEATVTFRQEGWKETGTVDSEEILMRLLVLSGATNIEVFYTVTLFEIEIIKSWQWIVIVTGLKGSGGDCYGELFKCNVCEWGQQVGYDTFNTLKAHHHHQRHQQL